MPPAPLTIRPAHLDDAPALARTHYESWMHAYRGVIDDAWLSTLSPLGFEGYHRPRLTPNAPPGEVYLVAVNPREPSIVAGFARCGPTRDKTPTGDPLPEGFAPRYACELYAIYVHPQRMGAGVGRALLAAAFDAARTLGSDSMCVWVLSGNRQARRFYEASGAVLCGDAPITLGGRMYPQTAYHWTPISRA